MARVAVVITKKEYEQARKDRRTRVLDIAALLVGLLLLSSGVGAVVTLEEKVPPQTDWAVQWADEDAGGIVCHARANPKAPCPLGQLPGKTTNDRIVEGETDAFTLTVPESATNVTEVKIKLTWVDETVDYEAWPNGKPSGKELPESWDCMTLTVEGPEGIADTGTHCGGKQDGEGGVAGGRVEFTYTFMPAPNQTEAQGKRDEVLRRLVTPPTHGGIGDWSFTITLDRAGDIRGNATTATCDANPDSCADAVAFFTNGGGLMKPPCYPSVPMGAGCEGSKTDPGQEWYMEFTWSRARFAGIV